MTDETRAHLIATGKGKQVETYDKALARHEDLQRSPTAPRPYCQYCEESVISVEETYDYQYKLCLDCIEEYSNQTGYCSLHCSMGGGCDGTC